MLPLLFLFLLAGCDAGDAARKPGEDTIREISKLAHDRAGVRCDTSLYAGLSTDENFVINKRYQYRDSAMVISGDDSLIEFQLRVLPHNRYGTDSFERFTDVFYINDLDSYVWAAGRLYSKFIVMKNDSLSGEIMWGAIEQGERDHLLKKFRGKNYNSYELSINACSRNKFGTGYCKWSLSLPRMPQANTRRTRDRSTIGII